MTEANRSARVAAVLPRLDALIEAEASREGIPRERVALVGFSQGAILALHLAATARPLAGVASLAGRLAGPVGDRVGARPGVLLSHGENDAVIPIGFHHAAAVALSAAGCRVDLHTLFWHGHAIASQQVARTIAHLREALGRDPRLALAS